MMREKNKRMDVLKMLISGGELSCQEDVLAALRAEGYVITQATLSRDMKQLKVAKAATAGGRYRYVLPGETTYRRMPDNALVRERALESGFRSINFSGSMVVIKTRPGYAASIAANIDSTDIPQILGSIAGYDTVFLVKSSGAANDEVRDALRRILPEID